MEVVHYNRTNNVPICNGCMAGTMQWGMQYYRGIGFGKFRAWRDELTPRAKRQQPGRDWSLQHFLGKR